MADLKPTRKTAASGAEALDELDRVKTLVAIDVGDGRTLPAGAEGTVVGVWGRGAAFEVEFARPLDALVTVKRSEVGRIAKAR